ncbi:MAG: sulfatase-like hydrolase/transferase, partial [bacterium]|nr:sulfatase-like hydrolase/transferase [bacterium]
MKTNPMVSRRCCRMVSVLMPVFLMTFILLSLGNGGRAIAAEPYTEPVDPFEVLSCNPAAACFLSVLQKVMPIQNAMNNPVGPNQPVVWDQGPPDGPSVPDPDDRPPNIILILADDMGFNDVSFYAERDDRTPTFQTPNIDSIAQQGVVFNNAYAASATCAPSRAAIMTGRYPTRSGYEFNPRSNIMFTTMQILEQCSDNYYKRILDSELLEERPGPAGLGMPQSETTLAETLKDAGYHTAHIGKWHLGDENFMRPEDQGFDESLSKTGGLYLPEDSPDVVNAYLTFSTVDAMMWQNVYSVQFN